MTKVLIRGGAGYMGSVITNWALHNNYKVRVVDTLWFDEKVPLAHSNNPNYEFVRADFGNDELLNRYLGDIDIVIHTAALVGDPVSEKFPKLAREINYKSSIRLIEKAQNLGVKGFIFLSTCSNYGISDGLATEDMPLNPLSLYAETKVNVERYLMGKSRSLDWVICRLSTAYGSSLRMRFDLTVNDFAMKAFTKKYLDIFLPHSFRPYAHVFDIARVVVKIIEKFDEIKNNVFNIGFEGENYRKIQIAEIIKEFIPETKIEIVKSGSDLRDYQVDFSKLKRILDIKNTYTVKDGAEEVLKLLRGRIIKNPYENCYYNTMPNLKEGEIADARSL